MFALHLLPPGGEVAAGTWIRHAEAFGPVIPVAVISHSSPGRISGKAGRMPISSRLSMQRNFHGTFHSAGSGGLVITAGMVYSLDTWDVVIAE
jgi:hypothetical protein